MSSNMPADPDQIGREFRSELIQRIRSDEAFAQALIADPVGPLEGTDLARKLDSLQNVEVSGYRAVESKCCITGIY